MISSQRFRPEKHWPVRHSSSEILIANQSRELLNELLRDTTRAQASLLAQIEVLDSFIFQARAQVAPIGSLPTEVLSIVFSFYALSHPRSLNTLTTVCRHWRYVAINNPRLWSIITIQISPKCVPLYLSRSQSLPLHIRIQPIFPLELWSINRITSFLQKILAPSVRKRIQSFDVTIPSRFTSERFADAFYRFTEHEPISLEHLTWINIELSCHSHIADEITLAGSATLVAAGYPAPQCPKLHSLAIRSPSEPSHLISHQLYRLTTHSALHTLELTDIHISLNLAPQPVSNLMPSLKTVKFRLIEPPALRYILESLSMQSVETLVLDFSGTGQPESHFTSTLPVDFPNLKSLSLIGLFTMDQSGWKNILSQNTGIEELTCESSSFGDAELGLLSSLSFSTPTESHPRLLPALKYLQMQSLAISWESVAALQMTRGTSGNRGVTPLTIIWMK